MSKQKMNDRQKAIMKAIRAAVKGSRNVVEQYEKILTEYHGVDRRSCDNASFMLNALAPMKHTQAAARKLLPTLLPVSITKKKGSYVVANTPNASKRQKEASEGKVEEFIALGLTSLLNHPSIKVEIEYDWSKRKGSLRKQVKEAVSHGVSSQELLALFQSVCEDVAQEQENGDVEAQVADIA